MPKTEKKFTYYNKGELDYLVPEKLMEDLERPDEYQQSVRLAEAKSASEELHQQYRADKTAVRLQRERVKRLVSPTAEDREKLARMNKNLASLKEEYESSNESVKELAKNIKGPGYSWVQVNLKKYGNSLLPKALIKNYGVAKVIMALEQMLEEELQFRVIDSSNMNGSEKYYDLKSEPIPKLAGRAASQYDVIVEIKYFGLDKKEEKKEVFGFNESGQMLIIL